MPRNRTLRRTALVFLSFPTLIAIGLALAVAVSLAVRFANDFWVMTLAASDPQDVAVAEAVAELHTGVDVSRVRVLRTDGPAAASAAIDSGQADLAIVRSDVALPKRAGTVLIVHKDAGLLLAAPRSKISKIADLTKKRVGIVPGSAANLQLFDELLVYHGLAADSVSRIPLQPDQIATLSSTKLVDAAFVVAPLQAALMQQVFAALAETEKSRPALIEIKNAEGFAARRTGVSKVDIPAGLFGGVAQQPSDDVATIAVDHQLVAALKMSEGTVDHLTKWFFSMRRALAERAPFAAYMEGAVTEKGSAFALHPGATAYYQDTEKSFFDQYGDWFYIMAMVFGGIGSAIASLISSFQARGRRTAMAVIDELIGTEEKARQAGSLAALNEFETAITRTALEALHRARESRFDEAGLETVRLAIDEARRAISTRRAELQEASATPAGAVAAFPVRRSEPTGGL